jgi:predicted dehydrogenase
MSNPSLVRVGVIGCGATATAVHLRVLRRLPGVRVTAIADPAPAARANASRLAPHAVALADADDLLARDDVDAVVVTAPSGLHGPIAVAALATGRHLYLEKPLAATLAEGQEVVAAAAATDAIAAVGFNYRFQPLVAHARTLVRAGVIGEIRSISTVFCEPGMLPGWKEARDQGGGVLLDLGSHHFDLIRWLVDSEIARVEATIRSDVTEHDSALVRLVLADGTTTSSYFSFRHGPAHSLELVGDRGVLRIDRCARTLSLRGARARTVTGAVLAWRARALVRPRSEPSWRYSLKAFFDVIGGSEIELPTLEDGLRSLEVVAAAERAGGP